MYIFNAGSCHHIWKIKDVTEVHVLWCCVYSGEGVANPGHMGKGKGTGHVVVTVHGCISSCLELVLPSKHYCLMELTGSVLLLLFFFCTGEVVSHLVFCR